MTQQGMIQVDHRIHRFMDKKMQRYPELIDVDLDA